MITIQTLQDFFGWCSILNIAIMLISFVIITTLREWAYKIHHRWFNLSRVHFDLILYCFLGMYKLLVFVFCIVPWIALSILN